jgi:hypothetical protein
LSEDKFFYLFNGEVLRSLKELEQEFKKNSLGVNLNNFNHHVSSGKNDYANWVRYVFNMPALADKLDACTSASDMFNLLSSFLSKPKKKPIKKVSKAVVDKKVVKKVVVSEKKPKERVFKKNEEPKELSKKPVNKREKKVVKKVVSKKKSVAPKKKPVRKVVKKVIKKHPVPKTKSVAPKKNIIKKETNEKTKTISKPKIPIKRHSSIANKKSIGVATELKEGIFEARSNHIFNPVELIEEKIEACEEFLELGLKREAMVLFNDLRKHFMSLNLDNLKASILRKKILDLYNKIKNSKD